MGEEEIKKAESQGITGTKLQIFNAAVDLFYERGYSNVGIRDIAKAAGIKSASIYNHYESKDALLQQIYKFFHDNYMASLPDLDEIMELVPKLSPYEVFEKLEMPLASSKGMFDTLRKIVLIVELESGVNSGAKNMVSELFAVNMHRNSTLLQRMVDMKTIKPINVDLFASILVRFGLSAASRVEDLRNLSMTEWKAGHRMLFELIRIKPDDDSSSKK